MILRVCVCLEVDIDASADERKLDEDNADPNDNGSNASDNEQVEVAENDGRERADGDDFPAVGDVSDIRSDLVLHDSLLEQLLEGIDGRLTEGAGRIHVDRWQAETVHLLCVVTERDCERETKFILVTIVFS